MAKQEVFIHVDDISVGIYEFPPMPALVNVVDAPAVKSWVRTGWLEGDQLECEDRVVESDRPIRPVVPAQDFGSIHSWLKVSPGTAWFWFWSAMPNYWLNRFRLTTELRALQRPGRGFVDVSRILRTRAMNRESFGHHADSLAAKTWALRYHRTNFRDAIDKSIVEPERRQLHAIRANAEFCAHDAACYSVLEEVARLLSLMIRIKSGNATPESFHTLHDERASQPQGLRDALDEMGWFEAFRQRRANTAHAFASLVGMHPEVAGGTLSQHPDRRIMQVPSAPTNDGKAALDVFNEFVKDFDNSLRALARYLLQLFHPFDVVSGLLLDPRKGGNVERKTVWACGIQFDPARASPDEGEVFADFDLTIRVRATEDGALREEK